MILETIQSPHDVAALSLEQLELLAGEIRQEIIRVCAHNGGHLAASLGAVDIAVAAHYVFPSESTRMVWDTGHQAYAHKLMTGRRESFSTIRTRDGLSGFLKRSESPYDHFGAGHACTALSAALGFSASARLQGRDRMNIALLGDGAATGGLVYEAINNTQAHGSKLLVILNDNEMSISPNVGAITRVLTRLTSTRSFLNLEGGTWRALGRIPKIGRLLRTLASRAKQGLKHLIFPGNFFEDFGFKYYGPLDGHDLSLLVRTMRQLREIQHPVILHVLTNKGKGYDLAEENPAKYHGFAPFDPETGSSLGASPSAPSYTEVFGEALLQMGHEDSTVTCISAAMPAGTGTDRFAEAFPERFFDVGIAEPHAVTFAAGLAADGLRPVVAIYSTFLQRAFDMIYHDVALQGLPVIFALDRAGIVGEDGPTHHGVLDLSYLRMIPGMVIMAPSDELELHRMMKTAQHYRKSPLAIRYPRDRGLGIDIPEQLSPLEIGKSRTLREGSKIHLWAIGSMVRPALEAASCLESRGFDPLVVDARFAEPLDRTRLLEEASKADLLVTVEENSSRGGFGEGVLACFREADMDAPSHLLLSLPHGFSPQGTRKEILAEAGLDASGIASSIEKALEKNPRFMETGVGGKS
ncbi:MAG: 1-deoxy-D-xylulose-5-phosphate synthase [Candidatus Krumholzibacteria bacterium]|jgi:1-deoxy-D-xylulose-5-phosphate synthase|nr:1-deoxy-D-xylulose-5-phosphate synthase [Candidatus Krumholzibacteria bacterium]MDP6669165.1 1-deoxy-D-xylulose-5-phosphate synthase [Candidatus Krumholzibacteria bacterium]MDP6797409.1 1-deoxy-D-xylulose-5-phosphate synthase [Candidatus Krumholzibacteria bacterium]MDP7020867.1 1-deoxy-D-xylulose-5-phosphate synthase [Candidatus Krumholzibacteria bacterium]